MREYDDITLKKLQKIELEILKDFIDLCEKNNLTYFAFAGTAIGAIRHKGFIPWDDDIDIAMPREDYNKFVKIAKKQYSDKYIVLSGKEYENYPLLTTQWVKKGTVFIVEPFKTIKDCPFGIFLDIFPLDKIPDDEKLFSKQAKKAFFYSKLLILRNLPFPVLPVKGWKAKVVHSICFCVHWGLRILHISKSFLYKKCMEVSTQYNSLEKTKRIAFLCGSTVYATAGIFEINDIFPLRKLPFEDIMINIPKNVEKHLTASYGDFMKLPAKEKRKNHFPYKLDFGEKNK